MNATTNAPALPDSAGYGIGISANEQYKESDGILVRGNHKVPYAEGAYLTRRR
jgi:hypothetical protein